MFHSSTSVVYAAFELAGGDFVSREISLADHGPFCHVEAVLRPGLSFRCHLIGGCRFVKDAVYDDHWILIPIEMDLARAIDWCRRHNGNKYDLWDVLLFVLRGWHLKWVAKLLAKLKKPCGEDFCSMGFAAMCTAAGGTRFERDRCIGPNDLYRKLLAISDGAVLRGSEYERSKI